MEWARKHVWESLGCVVVRAAGSHSCWDLVAIHEHMRVHLIQCKIVQTEVQANLMLRAFEKNPPMPASESYTMVLEVQVPRKGVFSTSVCM